MTKSARLPASREPISSPRPRLYAALMVAAQRLSAGVIFMCVEANDSTIGMEGVGDEPGLKSVARTTASPASIISRAPGNGEEPSAKTEPGKRTGGQFPRF